MEQTLDHLVPSQHLPTLSPLPLPPPSQLRTSLDRLQRLVAPHRVVIDLRTTSPDHAPSRDQKQSTLDAFELGYARQWLERVVSLGSRRLARAQEEVEMSEWEGLVQDGSYVLARLMGGSAAGGSEQVFILSSPLGKEASPLRIPIQETTLLSNSTGFRTWGSATLLAQRIASRPYDYFPTKTFPPFASYREVPLRPLRILELGSGTGLVGLTLVATLSALCIRSRIDLTDYEDSVLANLAHNLDQVRSEIDVGNVGCTISKLDWSDDHSELSSSTRSNDHDHGRAWSYDLIFAADVIYEPHHVELIHATVSALLRKPGIRGPTGVGEGSFHLALPLRSTHGLEMEAFEKAFPKWIEGREGFDDGEGLRLVVVHEELVRAQKGDDGFGSGSGAGAGKGGGNGVEEYRLVSIRWG